MIKQPRVFPKSTTFSSGPCAKRPGWSTAFLSETAVGRSHRSKLGKSKLRECLDRTRSLLELPTDYRIGIVPGSDTGAMESIMWSVLGARGVDLFAWESFGKDWVIDVTEQLRLDDVRVFEADYGKLPDLTRGDPTRDWIFVWNGTTSGVKVPHGNWIADNRGGLTICDATSAAFAMELPWSKLDAVTFSWQKVLGGEAGHGMLILSPRAVHRLESYTPSWPVPKICRLTKRGTLIEEIFEGSTINTPSLLCVEDFLSALGWAENIGGLPVLIARSNANLKVIEDWVVKTPWVDFLAADPAYRSNTSVCLKIVAPWFINMSHTKQLDFIGSFTELLETHKVAYDINSHRDAPPGLRIWAGATIEEDDLRALMLWLNWAFESLAESG